MSHVAPKSQLFAVFAALMVLTVATVLVSRLNLGYFNLPVAMVVAVTKALLVILIFMEVKYSPKLVQVTAGGRLPVSRHHDSLHDDRLPQPKYARRRRALAAGRFGEECSLRAGESRPFVRLGTPGLKPISSGTHLSALEEDHCVEGGCSPHRPPDDARADEWSQSGIDHAHMRGLGTAWR